MFGRGLPKEHFCKTLAKTSAVVSFHFSHYKSMETLFYNKKKKKKKSTRAISTRNVTLVEVTVMNIFAKFPLNPH